MSDAARPVFLFAKISATILGMMKPILNRAQISFLQVLAPIALFGILSISRCTSVPKADTKAASTLLRVSILSYNVENLFDTKHDPETEDFTFLPKSLKSDGPNLQGCLKNSSDYRRKECMEKDWSETELKEKMLRVGAVLKSVGDGRGADIVLLAEVENQTVLNLLNETELKPLGYKTSVLIEGFDPRGIDTAVLSRFEMWREPKLHRIPLKAQDAKGEYAATKTRGILEVPLVLPDGTKALAYALHFPSQGNPSYLREQAVQFLNQLEAAAPEGVVVIAGGDFNISTPEEKSLQLYSKQLNSAWEITHLEGCSNCFGTTYHLPTREWSFFDAVLLGRTQKSKHKWKMDTSSIAVPTQSKYQVSRFGGPARYDSGSPFGVSDHWPVYVELVKVEASDSKLK